MFLEKNIVHYAFYLFIIFMCLRVFKQKQKYMLSNKLEFLIFNYIKVWQVLETNKIY